MSWKKYVQPLLAVWLVTKQVTNDYTKIEINKLVILT